MTTIDLMDLEKLRGAIHVSIKDKEIWEKLLAIGEENLTEGGVELIRKIKLLRGLSINEINELCGIRSGDLDKVLNGSWKISVGLAKKLSNLGYSKESFLKENI